MEKENLKEKEIKQEKHVESTEESTKNETIMLSNKVIYL